MKRNIIVALLVAAVCCLSFPAGAQDSRNVSGCVYDENGTALANVIVRVDDSDLQFTTDENGRFEGQVGIYNNYLTAEKNGYKPRKQAIDGTYLIFRLTRTLTAEELQALADARARKLAEYDRKYKNHGLVQSVEFSWAYPAAEGVGGGHVQFANGDKQDVDAFPMSVNYLLSYRFNNYVQAGVGLGLLFYSDYPHGADIIGGKRHKSVDVPVYVNVKSAFTMTRFQPIASFSIGAFPVYKNFLMEMGIGANYRIDRNKSAYILLTWGDTPCYCYTIWSQKVNYYECPDWGSIGFRVGFSF